VEIGKKTYERMPPELQELFEKLPNLDREEVVGMFPQTTTHSGVNRGYAGGSMFGCDGVGESVASSGSAARFFYAAKASRAERNAGCEGMPERQTDRYGECGQGNTAQQTPRRSRIEANTHPTVKPLSLMRWLLTLATMPERNLILDPFLGSGSTGVAAVQLGLPFVGIELEQESFDIAVARIRAELGGLSPAERAAGQRSLLKELA